jgi:glutaredoxin
MRRLRTALLIAALCAAPAACTRQAAVDAAALRAVVGDAPVVLLSATWCGYCRKLRADLDRWGVRYREYDVEHSERGARAYAQLRSSGVPVLLVGERRFHGYVPRRIHQSLSEAGLLGPAASP